MTKEKKLSVIEKELELYEKTLKNLQMCIHELREEIQEMLPKCEKVFHDKKVFTINECTNICPYHIFPIDKTYKVLNYVKYHTNATSFFKFNYDSNIHLVQFTKEHKVIATCIPSLKLVIIVER